MSEAAAPLSDEPGRAPNDVRPVIPTGSSSNWGLWGFLGVLAIGGAVLFNALNASRQAVEVPSTFQPSGDAAGRIASPAPLQVPERFAARPDLAPALREDVERAPVPTQPQLSVRDIPPPVQPPVFVQPVPLPPRTIPAPAEVSEDTGPQVVFDARSAADPSPRAGNDNPQDAERVTAGRFLNPSRTIPQGTVIPAVLETALDSTRAGGVRALVQRDIFSFDGTRVLVPRGSRLYGEYEANLQPGQNRALVQWTRLIRPDGVTMDLNSPSSDPLGRAGIKGRVDTKFLQRFGNALLQSIVDVGVNIGVSEATDGVIVALPGSTQNLQVNDPQRFQPTLRVKHGTSVSVFVARDLDFSTVES